MKICSCEDLLTWRRPPSAVSPGRSPAPRARDYPLLKSNPHLGNNHRLSHVIQVWLSARPGGPSIELPSCSFPCHYLDRSLCFQHKFPSPTVRVRLCPFNHLPVNSVAGWHFHRNRRQQPRGHHLPIHLQSVLRLRHQRETYRRTGHRRLLRGMVRRL